MLDSWLPFLMYGTLALVIPASMILMSFVFATRPARRTKTRTAPVRVRRLAGLATGEPLHGRLLPDGDALHRLRHRDRLPVSARASSSSRSAGSASSSSRSSSRSSRSRTSTSGGRGLCSGGETEGAARGLGSQLGARALAREGAGRLRAGARGGPRGQADADDGREGGPLGAGQLDLAGHLRARVLRDRDDVDRLVALRRRPLRRRGLPLLAPPGRPADRLRPGRAQDGGAAAADLRPDARAEVGDRDGRLCQLGRDVQQLRHPPGRRQDRRRRRPRARLPAAARSAPRGDRPPPGEDQGGRAAGLRDSRGAQADVRGRPRAGRAQGRARRDDARRRSGAPRRGLPAPPGRGGLRLPLRHHAGRLPRLGRERSRRLLRHEHRPQPERARVPGARPHARAQAGPLRRQLPPAGDPRRARRSSGSRSGSRTARASRASSRCGRPPTGTSERRST